MKDGEWRQKTKDKRKNKIKEPRGDKGQKLEKMNLKRKV